MGQAAAFLRALTALSARNAATAAPKRASPITYAKERVLQPIFEMDWAISGVKNLAQNFTPSYIEQVTVRVTGTPLSDMKRIYQLALAAAFGTVPGFGTRAGSRGLTASYNYASKVVEVRYYWSYSFSLTGAIGNGPRADGNGPQRLAYGPAASNTKNIVGQTWPGYLNSGTFGTLPDANDAIMSYGQQSATAIPQPAWDSSSRENDILRIATQLIMSPCCAPQPADQSQSYQIFSPSAATTTNSPALPTNLYGVPDQPSLPINLPIIGLLNIRYDGLFPSWEFDSGAFSIEQFKPYATAHPNPAAGVIQDI